MCGGRGEVGGAGRGGGRRAFSPAASPTPKFLSDQGIARSVEMIGGVERHLGDLRDGPARKPSARAFLPAAAGLSEDGNSGSGSFSIPGGSLRSPCGALGLPVLRPTSETRDRLSGTASLHHRPSYVGRSLSVSSWSKYRPGSPAAGRKRRAQSDPSVSDDSG